MQHLCLRVDVWSLSQSSRAPSLFSVEHQRVNAGFLFSFLVIVPLWLSLVILYTTQSSYRRCLQNLSILQRSEKNANFHS